MAELTSLRAQVAQIQDYENRLLAAIEQKAVAQENLKILGQAVEGLRAKNMQSAATTSQLENELKQAKADLTELSDIEQRLGREQLAMEELQKQILTQKTETDRFRAANTESAAKLAQAQAKPKVDPAMAQNLQLIADENNRLNNELAATKKALNDLLVAPPTNPTSEAQMEKLVKENTRLTTELESTEAQLIKSELRVQDLVVQQQEVLARLKRLLSASN